MSSRDQPLPLAIKPTHLSTILRNPDCPCFFGNFRSIWMPILTFNVLAMVFFCCSVLRGTIASVTQYEGPHEVAICLDDIPTSAILGIYLLPLRFSRTATGPSVAAVSDHANRQYCLQYVSVELTTGKVLIFKTGVEGSVPWQLLGYQHFRPLGRRGGRTAALLPLVCVDELACIAQNGFQ